MVTFSKRRKGLFKKVAELHSRTAAKAALVVFPGRKSLYSGQPSIDSVINDHFRLVGHQENEGNNVVVTGICSSVLDIYGKNLERREVGAAVNPAKEWLEGVKVEECENLEEVTVVMKKLEEIERGCEDQELLSLFDD